MKHTRRERERGGGISQYTTKTIVELKTHLWFLSMLKIYDNRVYRFITMTIKNKVDGSEILLFCILDTKYQIFLSSSY